MPDGGDESGSGKNDVMGCLAGVLAFYLMGSFFVWEVFGGSTCHGSQCEVRTAIAGLASLGAGLFAWSWIRNR